MTNISEEKKEILYNLDNLLNNYNEEIVGCEGNFGKILLKRDGLKDFCKQVQSSKENDSILQGFLIKAFCKTNVGKLYDEDRLLDDPKIIYNILEATNFPKLNLGNLINVISNNKENNIDLVFGGLG